MKQIICILILTLTSLNALAATAEQFQVEINKINAYFNEARRSQLEKGHSTEPLTLQLEIADPNQVLPQFRLSKDFSVLSISMPEAHLSDPEKFFIFLTVLGRALDFPVTVASTYQSDISKPKILEILNQIKDETRYNSFFHLMDMAHAENQEREIFYKRWYYSYLISSRHAVERGSLLNNIFKDIEILFPETQVDVLNLRKMKSPLEKNILAHMQTREWSQAQKFFASLGSDEFHKMVLNNDREGVAQYLEKHLPKKIFTNRELVFWKDQIEAIRNPDPNKAVILLRGGDYSIGHWAYGSRSMVQKPINSPKRWWLDGVLSNLSVQGTMYKHSFHTSNIFISTTTSLQVANDFSKRDALLSVIKIDPRRGFLPRFGKSWGEDEILIPLVIFPEEIVTDSQKSSLSGIESRYATLAEESKRVFLNKRNLDESRTGQSLRCSQLFY